MMIPVTFRYDLESVATLYSMQESPYDQLKHDYFLTFLTTNPFHVIFETMIPWKTSEASL